MNKQRRNQIIECVKELENIKGNLENILSEEEFSYDNMPENLQSSLRGEQSEEAIDILTDATDTLEEIINNLQEI